MPKIERVAEVVNGNLDLNHLLAQIQSGWKLVALEWQREIAAEPESTVTATAAVPMEEIPYGVRIAQDCHSLEVDPVENQVLIEMMNLMVDDLPLSRVAADLNGRGYRTRQGEPWTMASVFNMLPRLIDVGPRIFTSTEWEKKRSKIARAR